MSNAYLRTMLLLFITIAYSGCGNYDAEIQQKDKELLILRNTIDSLSLEIQRLNITPQVYWNQAIDELDEGNIITAIELLEELQIKFPQSEFVASANNKVKEIELNDDALTKDILTSIKKMGALESIELLNTTLESQHLQRNVQTLESAKARNVKLYQRERTLIEAESQTGVKIISVDSFWGRSTSSSGYEILVPKLRIKLKNSSERNIERLQVKVTFMKQGGDVFGSDYSYVIGYSDTPLRPGQSKTAFLSSDVGVRSIFPYNVPSLNTEIYINDMFYKSMRHSIGIK